MIQMKKLIFHSMIFLLGFSFYSGPLNAQFLKKIMNSVKQTAQDRANSKAQQSANKGLDKVDHTVFGTPTSATDAHNPVPVDTSSTNKLFGAFAEAARQNPNDTSAADLTMKGLGIFIGGGGVSSADSAAAIKAFMNASGGSGFRYQFVTSLTSKELKNFRDTMVASLTAGGYGRSEMNMHIPSASGHEIITLSHAADPHYSVMLQPEDKIYSLNVIDTSLINAGNETYQVTKIGSEEIQGYSCVHSRISAVSNNKYFSSSVTYDIWTSTGVPGYSVYERLVALHNVKPGIMQALQKAGCDGFFVKMTSTEKDNSVEMELIKAAKESFPATLFEIPAGYTMSGHNLMFNMPGGKK
jgi:hypothetical protein